ncbi:MULTISPECIES: hypothetical protein [unclassified Lysobacter]|uniref:hypothetical protein n=1 Tax=unclassified Lysobacter TaxID=2635362 RepID=UPI000AFC7AA6|nr:MULTISPECIES: hypothetical protein [unclassified Lysobacter]
MHQRSMHRRSALILSLTFVALAAHAREPKLDDPRPNGYLSLRERSSCEPPEQHPDWCQQPHEVRAFLERYDLCEHWAGEPSPEGNDADDRERRKEIGDGVRSACTGNDRRLAELRRRYRNVPAVAALLSELEPNYGP